MAIKIPTGFNYKNERLDGNETYIRDFLNLNIEGWAKFRYTINIGNDPNKLHSESSITNEIKDAYIELAKTHYEFVNSLGMSKISMDNYFNHRSPISMINKKYVKEFYFHLCNCLDSLSRLIYIINDPNSSINKDKKKRFTRHIMDWSLVKSYTYKGYINFFKSSIIKEIITIRNNLTHRWWGVIEVDENNNYRWPIAYKKSYSYLWPYYEASKVKKRYKRWEFIKDTLIAHFNFFVLLQNRIFKRLIKDIKKFEIYNNLKIIK